MTYQITKNNTVELVDINEVLDFVAEELEIVTADTYQALQILEDCGYQIVELG